MSGKSLLRKWIGEYNAAVVVTVATAEAENICLKNGLLFHELLSSFGHLDGLNTTVRTGNQSFTMTDAHIRFERSTEAKGKNAEQVEKLMRETFEEFEMHRIPQNVGELKASPPSSWTSKAEHIAMRLQAFHEWEMTSHPYLILTVVATSDVDHVLCMQELASAHHTPACLANGQYDPASVQRLFILLHDAHDTSRNPYVMLQQLQARFSAASTKLLTINSFPESSPNLQQPDMWSRFLAPRFFPQGIPENANSAIPINPTNGQPALGSRLSMEDFMSLRNFCVDMYNQYIVPNIEKRLVFLNKQVNDNKKGMKNVLKSFWRKSRDDSEGGRGQVKYRFDKIESQILLLADTSFMIKDFETAYAMYKLVRDDFRSDKSLLHLAHTHLMMAACQVVTEPGKTKELHPDLEALGQLLAANAELPHVSAYYALLAAEMYVLHTPTRAPLEAAGILLLSVKNMQSLPLLSSMLIEKAAAYFLQASQARKYVFYSTIVANKMLRCGPRPSLHAAVSFAVAMLVVDQTNWGDLKAKLCKALSDNTRFAGKEGARRSLMLMLKMLASAMCEGADVGQSESFAEAANVYREIIAGGAWGHFEIQPRWTDMTARAIMLDPLPTAELSPPVVEGKATPASYCEVADLPVPVVDVRTAVLINSASGVESGAGALAAASAELQMAEEMYAYLELERQWAADHVRSPQSPASEEMEDTFADKWAELESQLMRQRESGKSASTEDAVVRVPLGEKVKLKVRMTNKLPLDLVLDDLRVAVEPAASFATKGVALSLQQDQTKEIVLLAQPLQVGKYRIDCAKWNLSDSLCVRQSLSKPGPLLQRTRQQRANGERGPDTTLSFEVVPAHPLLKMEFEGLSAEVLQGQLLKSTLVLRNEGAAPACDIYIKLSQPLFVFYLSQVIDSDGSTKCTSPSSGAHGVISMQGGSSTVMRLSEGTTIAPGQALRFEAWMMVSRIGLQKVSLLSSYKALLPDGTKQAFGPGTRCRTSFLSIKTKVLPSLGIALRLVPKPSSVVHFTLVTEIVNYLRNVDLENSPAEFGQDRFSSMGQLDLPDLTAGDDHIEIEDNAIKVVGLWLLGAGVPFRYKPSPREILSRESGARAIAGAPDLLACPSERIARCFPVKLALPASSLAATAVAPSGKCSWLLPMPAPATSKDTHNHLVRVIEQFLCIASATSRFDKDVESSRLLVQAAELEAETMGPRSIAQVRREKQGSSGADTAASSSTQAQIQASGAVGAQDIADLAAARNGLTVAAVWACRWEGKLRWGMHKISSLSFVGEGISAVGGQQPVHAAVSAKGAAGVVSPSVPAAPSSGKPAADYLLVGIHHAPTYTIGSAADSAVEVPVTVRLRSLSSEPLSVTIAALDFVSAETHKNTPAGPHYVYNDNPEFSIEKVANLGMRWNGKTQHIGIALLPNTETEVTMRAYITKPGTFNLNKFKVTARFSQSSSPQQTLKQIGGQSLVTVNMSV